MGKNTYNAQSPDWDDEEKSALKQAYETALTEDVNCFRVHSRAAELLREWGYAPDRSYHAIRCKASQLGIIVSGPVVTRTPKLFDIDKLESEMPVGTYIAPGERPGKCACGSSAWCFDKIFDDWTCINCGTVKYVRKTSALNRR